MTPSGGLKLLERSICRLYSSAQVDIYTGHHIHFRSSDYYA